MSRYDVLKSEKPSHIIHFDYVDVQNVPSVICHIEIFKWSKTTKPLILSDIKEVALSEPLDKYVIWDGLDSKFLKFIKLAGFRDSGFYTESYGDKEYVYVWSDK